ncbi:MAG: hypothetical protein JNM84_15240 [Planctomycetes bacterium]|nr:hypothetical protein [Planctomycetota bacterium]
MPQLSALLPRAALALCIAATTALPALAQTKRYPIGEEGAKLELGKYWKRQQVNPTAGEDQFRCTESAARRDPAGDVFAIVLEHRTLAENDADYRRLLDLMTIVGHDEPFQVQREARWTRVTRAFTTELEKQKLAFHVDLLVRPGLVYSIASFAAASRAAWLAEKANEVVEGLEFPGPGRPWADGLAPTRRQVEVDGFRLSFELRPSVWTASEQADAQALLALEDGMATCALFVFEETHRSLDAALTASAKLLAKDHGDFVEVRREPIERDGCRSRRLVGRSSTLSFDVIAIPLEGQRTLMLRLLWPGAPELERPERDHLLATLQLESTEEALPVIELEQPAPRSTRWQRLLESSELVATFPVNHLSRLQALPDGRWLAIDWSSASVWRADGSSEELIAHENELASLELWRGRWYATNRAGELRVVENGSFGEELLGHGTGLASTQEHLLVGRAAEAQRDPAMSFSWYARRSVLVRRDSRYQESELAELPRFQISEITKDAEERRVILQGYGHDERLGSFGERLYVVELANGAISRAGDWTAIQAIVPAPGGWLITGRPAEERAGIWHVRGAAERELLLAAPEVRGVALREGQLEFALSSGTSHELRRIARDALARHGMVQPFSAPDLDALGRLLLEAPAPRTRAEIAQAVEKVQAAAQKLRGAPLPVGELEVDELFDSVVFGPGIDAPGRALLTVLCAHALLEAGATWVEPARADWASWLASRAPQDESAFSMAVHPGRLIVSALDDSESASQPLAPTLAVADGRRILVGIEVAASSAKVVELEPRQFASAIQALDVEALRKILSSVPENRCARLRTYGELETRGATEALAAISADHAQRSPEDRRALLGARLRLAKSPTERSELLPAIEEATREHPRDAALWLLLGRACEQVEPAQLDRARAAYTRARKLEPWGDVGQAAEAALKRLK